MSRKPEAIAVKKLVDFRNLLGDRHRICVSVGPELEPVVLSLDCKPDYRRLKNGASFPKLETEKLNAFKIHFLKDGEWSELSLPPTHENYHLIQPLKGSGWLLVRGRANGNDDCNAQVFSAVGRHIRSFAAGDGIQDVQVDKSGKIWISYFDEGVFGETTLGNSGLVCLDSSGKLVFDFQAIPHPCVQSMADCYAVNVCSDKEVWLCYYTDFPLVKLVDYRLASVWPRFPVSGSPAFAILDNRALFAGGYKRGEHLFLVDLRSLNPREIVPVNESGQRLKKFQSFGRRSRLFMATNESLFVIDLADVDV